MNDTSETGDKARAAAYWRENVKLLCILLAIWFAVSFGAGVLFVDMLNAVRIGGFKLGFWFAQQGSIVVFVVLIFVYAARMRVLEKRFGVSEE
jgi:putative solute:sodium symporter small subunit